VSGSTIRVFLRPGCHLCEDALAGMEAVIGAEQASRIEKVDIEASDALLRDYLERIPVVEVDGVEVSELEFDSDEFRRAINTASGPSGQVA
jgi:hypothetical protein